MSYHHDVSEDQEGTAGTGRCWGPQGEGEQKYWKVPHQHPVSDLQHARNAQGDYGRLPKGECGLNCNKCGHTSQRCKIAAKCQWFGKGKHEDRREGPKLWSNCNGPHASSAQGCQVWQKQKEIQRVCVEKHIWFPEARQLVEAQMPTVISSGKSFSAVVSTRKEMKSEDCQTQLTWVFWDRPLRTVQCLWRTRFGIGRHPNSLRADPRVPCESATGSESDNGWAGPFKTASPPNPPTPTPTKTASPGPSKTAPSTDDSSSSRATPSKVRVEGVVVNVEGFITPRHSTPSVKPQFRPYRRKEWVTERRRRRIYLFQTSILSVRWRDGLTETMEHSNVQQNMRGFQANFEKRALLARRYRPALFGLQETLWTNSETPPFSGFSILTKTSLNDRATLGVARSLATRVYLVKSIWTPLWRRWLRR